MTKPDDKFKAAEAAAEAAGKKMEDAADDAAAAKEDAAAGAVEEAAEKIQDGVERGAEAIDDLRRAVTLTRAAMREFAELALKLFKRQGVRRLPSVDDFFGEAD